MATQKGRTIIWGVRPMRPITNLPPDALRCKIRMRNERPATAFVQFEDRIERWIIVPADGTLACPEWSLGFLQGVNYAREMVHQPAL